MALWYPSEGTESPYKYSADLSGSLIVNGGPFGCARFPLVIFSHGFGGCGIQSVFFTEELARAGYIVAAPDHKDAGCTVDGGGSLQLKSPEQSFFDPAKWTALTEVDRKVDLGSAVDWVLRSPDFAPVVDPDKIGAAGHSLGGYTVLGMSGAWPSWKDSRIKASLLLSPYLIPFLTQKLMDLVDIPLMYQGAQFDLGITPFVRGDTGAYGLSKLPKFYAELFGGNHFEWTNALCFGQASVSSCLSSKPNARLINAYGIAFFDRYLGRNAAAVGQLAGAGLASYKRNLPLSTKDAASYKDAAIAADSIASIFSELLTNVTKGAEGDALPMTLGGLTVSIQDAAGATHTAPLFFVSPNQVNLVMPAAAASGRATVSVRAAGSPVATGTTEVTRVSPSVFSADASGAGIAAAGYIRVGRDGSRTDSIVFDSATLRPVPIDLTNAATVYVVVYGSGMRNAGTLEATVAGQLVPVAGPFRHSRFPGLDQANIGPLPASLAGAGSATIVLTLDGKATNPVSILLQ